MNSLLIIMIVSIWFTLLILLSLYILYNKILPKYHTVVSDVSFQELLIALNAAINTELELWEKDVFVNTKSITNSNFDNYYEEITTHIIRSLSPIFFINMGKYITEDAVVTIIGRKTKEYLTGKINGSI